MLTLVEHYSSYFTLSKEERKLMIKQLKWGGGGLLSEKSADGLGLLI